MNEWLIGIVGVVFLGVMLDIIYPSGKTNKFCKGIFGVFVIYVILSPLLKIKSIEFDMNANSIYLNTFADLRKDSIGSQIETSLGVLRFQGVDVEIDGNIEDNEFVIDNIYVDITNLVLSENLANINKYEVITSEIKKITEIDDSRIIIYG